jgi:5-methylthioadenosine/S-adenosylhomocysteine deaminase
MESDDSRARRNGPRTADLVISAAWALPCDGGPPLRDAVVAVRGGRITAVDTREQIGHVTASAAEVIDFGSALILPGLVNAHSHLEYTHAGPITRQDGRTFTGWIAELMAWSRAAPSADRLASARAGAKAMLRGGITCVGDIVTRGQGLRAMVDAGLHGVAFFEFVGGYPVDNDTTLAARLDDLLERAEAASMLIDGLPGAAPGIRLGISPHAPYTVSEAALRRVTTIARRNGWPLACHLAESAGELEFLAHGTGEVADFMGGVLSLGRPLQPEVSRHRPVAYAEAGGLLAAPARRQDRPNTLVIHGAHLSQEDVVRLTRADVSLVSCPRSNELLSAGAEVPIRHLAQAGLRLGLGTDSLASNTVLDLFGEMRALREIWSRQDPRVDPDQAALRLLSMATCEGAAALGLQNELGTLTEGKRADLAVTDLPDTAGGSALATAVVEQLHAGAVRATFTEGICRYHRD